MNSFIANNNQIKIIKKAEQSSIVAGLSFSSDYNCYPVYNLSGSYLYDECYWE